MASGSERRTKRGRGLPHDCKLRDGSEHIVATDCVVTTQRLWLEEPRLLLDTWSMCLGDGSRPQRSSLIQSLMNLRDLLPRPAARWSDEVLVVAPCRSFQSLSSIYLRQILGADPTPRPRGFGARLFSFLQPQLVSHCEPWGTRRSPIKEKPPPSAESPTPSGLVCGDPSKFRRLRYARPETPAICSAGPTCRSSAERERGMI